ncbi:MAG: hypothetical protein GWN39_02240, partial [Thermoplasmata archaeon]|nr:hypothetical protein [Thermoplasmata archaeon]NIS10838.1 hypothetical protein [Thermoplasmata archaeon]NIS18770.1 hypothetical protein [Thermoplasmata archaeon]NIT75796.1 hypothetical protein [Thermoplasmata archaeon]NIV77583.1 hypothetical protein [Thermoplasmata archaeon]
RDFFYLTTKEREAVYLRASRLQALISIFRTPGTVRRFKAHRILFKKGIKTTFPVSTAQLNPLGEAVENFSIPSHFCSRCGRLHSGKWVWEAVCPSCFKAIHGYDRRHSQVPRLTSPKVGTVS